MEGNNAEVGRVVDRGQGSQNMPVGSGQERIGTLGTKQIEYGWSSGGNMGLLINLDSLASIHQGWTLLDPLRHLVIRIDDQGEKNTHANQAKITDPYAFLSNTRT